MSQAKVDRYKQEKKNRYKELKKKKARKICVIVVLAALVGGAIGFPLGKKIYKDVSAKQRASATVSIELYDVWMQQYWSQKYSGILGTPTDALPSTDDAATASTGDASTSDAE